MLKEFRSRARGIGDLLNYAVLADDGIMLLKDGAFLGGWYYAGPDLESASHEELAVQSAQMNAALSVLGNGWMLNVDAHRRAASDYPEGETYFPDPTTAVIEEERRLEYNQRGRHFETVYALTLTYKPPAEAKRKLSAFFFEGEEERKRPGWEQVLEFFRRNLDQIEDSLSAVLSLDRMDSAGLLTHLHTCISGLHHPVRVPRIPAYMDSVLGSEDLYGGFAPRIGRLHVRPVGVTGFPLESYPEILGFLNRLATEYRWSNRFIFLDPHTAERHLRSYRRNWFQKRLSLMGLVKEGFNTGSQTFMNQDAVAMARDADAAVAEASSNAVRFGYYTCAILIMNEDAAVADASARELAKQLQHHGFPARIEEANAIEAYLGSLPGHGWPNVRRPLVHTLNLADFLPLTSVWSGLETNPCPYYPPRSPALVYAATGSTPFRLNLHVSDVGHTLVFGPTGSGKSTLLGLLMAQFFRYPKAQVFAFDKGYSSFILARAAGGEHYDFFADEAGELAFYPLSGVDRAAERLWAEGWLENLLVLQGVVLSPGQRRALHRGLELLGSAPAEARTLTDLAHTLQDQVLRDGLHHYTLAGALGALLDAKADSLGTARFQVFEMEHLMNMGEKNLVPVLLYLFHRIDQRLDAGIPTLLVIDEAWVMLAHSLFGEKIEEWLRTLRKKNAAVVFASQSISEVVRSSKRDVVIESCATKIFLPNPEAETEHSRALYRSLGLTERQLEVLAHATPKRHYYYVSPHGRRLVDLPLGPLALAFTGATGREDIQRARELMRDHGAAWPAQWLRDRQLSESAERWLAISAREEGKRCAA